ncbi:Cell division cycle-related protein res1/sct1 [Erysiphe neolycopersici]|uniref:Cell division cycle-related protein res1/sct1 n=1 Tax=Erysiphe neolycopersici TaxID=212602 RepID=A0A420HUQ6_9PEZI|nr:Cell division cycle-related protein res1/sct1 [Erysiphe neolycopersici]
MVKLFGPRVFTATYSNTPVYEFQFGDGLKEHVMRRRGDNWINATHILKAAGFDKPTRTRILEREVQKGKHEKVQGGYGKYQGTWVPLEQGQALAQRNQVYEKLRAIFEYMPGLESPPIAPKHTIAKPKANKKNSASKTPRSSFTPNSVENEDGSIYHIQQSIADHGVDNSFVNIDESCEMLPPSSNHRKHKRPTLTVNKQAHVLYSDELLDYFMLSRSTIGRIKPEPPSNFNPDWIVDNEGHTALHWAAAMGDIEIIRDLKRYGANIGFQNARGESPLMRCVIFDNCMDKKTMPEVVNEFIETVDLLDFCQATVLHHAAAVTVSHQKHSYARYYLDILLNNIQEFFEPQLAAQIINAQDIEGNTALHIAAKHGARNCVRALIGRCALINIRNNHGITAEDLIRDLIETRRIDHQSRDSSSPFGITNYVHSNRDVPEDPQSLSTSQYTSQTALSIQSRVAPQLIERTKNLAASFDKELKDKDVLERDTRRILNSTIAESDEIEQQVNELQEMRDLKQNPENIIQSMDELNSFQMKFISLVEQQQMNQLQSSYESEHQKLKEFSNEESETERDQLLERIKLSRTLSDQQKQRQDLVQSYLNARSMVGGGGKSDLYRRFFIKSFGPDISLVDENLGSLVKQLKQNPSTNLVSV